MRKRIQLEFERDPTFRMHDVHDLSRAEVRERIMTRVNAAIHTNSLYLSSILTFISCQLLHIGDKMIRWRFISPGLIYWLQLIQDFILGLECTLDCSVRPSLVKELLSRYVYSAIHDSIVGQVLGWEGNPLLQYHWMLCNDRIGTWFKCVRS